MQALISRYIFILEKLKIKKFKSYIHACTNETHSIENLHNLFPTIAEILDRQHKLAKGGIKSSTFSIECGSFVHAWM